MANTPKWNERTTLTQLMKRKYNIKGHKSIFIYGEKGAGKSTYALLCAYSMYKDWEKVFKYTVFTRRELLQRISECFDLKNKKVIKRIPILIWDDATFENIRSRQRDRFIEEFSKFYTLIRSVVANFIWTSPSFTLLPSKLQNMEWTLIRISRIDTSSSLAHFYRYNQMPNGKVYLSCYRIADQKVKQKFYFKWFPNDVRERYEVMRDGYSVDGFIELQKAYNLMQKQRKSEEEIVNELSRRLKFSVMDNPSPKKKKKGKII